MSSRAAAAATSAAMSTPNTSVCSISRSHSYTPITVATVRAVVTEGKFQLIETAAERVAARLLADYRLGWVRVEVAKPLPAEGYTAVVTIEREGR